MTVKTLTIDGKLVSAREDETILEAAREAGIAIPTLCHLDGSPTSAPAGSAWSRSPAAASCCRPASRRSPRAWRSRPTRERLREYRRMIVELLFAERNHVCSVCVANGHCELQDLAVARRHGPRALRLPVPELRGRHQRTSASASTTTAASSAPAASASATRSRARTPGTSPAAAPTPASSPT